MELIGGCHETFCSNARSADLQIRATEIVNFQSELFSKISSERLPFRHGNVARNFFVGNLLPGHSVGRTLI